MTDFSEVWLMPPLPLLQTTDILLVSLTHDSPSQYVPDYSH